MDAQVVEQTSLSSYYDNLQTLSSSVQNDLGETLSTSSTANTATGITAGMNNFWSAWQALASDPSSTIQRDNSISSAGDLANTINSTYQGLTSTKGAMITAAQTNAEKLNTYAGEVASLNQQIAETEIQTQSPPNQLVDQREYLIEQMAQLTNLTVNRKILRITRC